MAPGAKLAFIDIGFDNGALSLPSDDRLLGTGRNPLGQGPPAHIHSASWGVIGENGYNYQCRSFDSYMYSNDDFLILVAAGNDGRYDSRNTVSAPSTAKNVISVGASHSYADDLEGGMLGPAHVADFSSRGPTADGRVKVSPPGQEIRAKYNSLPHPNVLLSSRQLSPFLSSLISLPLVNTFCQPERDLTHLVNATKGDRGPVMAKAA